MKLIYISRAVRAINDSRARKIMSSLSNDFKANTAFFYERNCKPHSGSYSSQCPYHVVNPRFSSTRDSRPGAIYTIFEIIQECILNAYYFLSTKSSHVILVNHRQILSVILFHWVRRIIGLKKLVWDLQELPTGFLNKDSFAVKFFIIALNCCDHIFVTNKGRLDYMVSIYGPDFSRKTSLIPNYIDHSAVYTKVIPLEKEFLAWLGDEKYYYIQNPASVDRYSYTSIKATLLTTDNKIVVTGQLYPVALKKLKLEFPNFSDRVFLTGMVNEELLLSYIDNAHCSLIFYNKDTPNNNFCDPNRLFQSIARGVPVLTGDNIGLSSIVNKHKIGITISGDGKSVSSISKGITELENKYDFYKKNARKCCTEFLWENNESSLRSFI